MDTDELKNLAQQHAGNWTSWRDFAWFGRYGRPDEGRDCYIWNYRTRDDRLLDKSNAAMIDKAFKPFFDHHSPYVGQERHSHWACGWVECLVIQVHDKWGRITKAFEKAMEIQAALEQYPILDEGDYYGRELEATLENIQTIIRYDLGYELPDDITWLDAAWAVHDWLSSNGHDNELENRDDQGGWPDEKLVKEALVEIFKKSPKVTVPDNQTSFLCLVEEVS